MHNGFPVLKQQWQHPARAPEGFFRNINHFPSGEEWWRSTDQYSLDVSSPSDSILPLGNTFCIRPNAIYLHLKEQGVAAFRCWSVIKGSASLSALTLSCLPNGSLPHAFLSHTSSIVTRNKLGWRELWGLSLCPVQLTRWVVIALKCIYLPRQWPLNLWGKQWKNEPGLQKQPGFQPSLWSESLRPSCGNLKGGSHP